MSHRKHDLLALESERIARNVLGALDDLDQAHGERMGELYAEVALTTARRVALRDLRLMLISWAERENVSLVDGEAFERFRRTSDPVRRARIEALLARSVEGIE